MSAGILGGLRRPETTAVGEMWMNASPLNIERFVADYELEKGKVPRRKRKCVQRKWPSSGAHWPLAPTTLPQRLSCDHLQRLGEPGGMAAIDPDYLPRNIVI
jgi:hypothetical protein